MSNYSVFLAERIRPGKFTENTQVDSCVRQAESETGTGAGLPCGAIKEAWFLLAETGPDGKAERDESKPHLLFLVVIPGPTSREGLLNLTVPSKRMPNGSM